MAPCIRDWQFASSCSPRTAFTAAVTFTTGPVTLTRRGLSPRCVVAFTAALRRRSATLVGWPLVFRGVNFERLFDLVPAFGDCGQEQAADDVVAALVRDFEVVEKPMVGILPVPNWWGGDNR